ncbi:MAG: DNA methyltransferase [Candidatus Aenigmatarchaeota archaeon]
MWVEEILEDLNHLKEILSEGSLFTPSFKSSQVEDYYTALTRGLQEAQTVDLLKKILEEILQFEDRSLIREYRVGTTRKAIDIGIEDELYGVIGIEVKPFAIRERERLILTDIRKLIKNHKRQIEEYLYKTSNLRFLLLTNLINVAIFTKASRLEEELSFLIKPFDEFVREYIKVGRLRDYLFRLNAGFVPKDLDNKFLKELKEYWKSLSFLEEGDRAKLINTLIMLRTLEDNHAIGYGWVEKEWKYAEMMHKDVYRNFLRHFFNSFVVGVLYEYYDTELLHWDIASFLDKYAGKEGEIKASIGQILGLEGLGQLAFRGLKFYDFSQINEDIFGNAYESFLAELRRERGIFYTRAFVAEFISKKVVQKLFTPLIEKAQELLTADSPELIQEKTKELLERLSAIRIIDPACGSGSFLIKVLKEIYLQFYKPLRDSLKAKINQLKVLPNGFLFSLDKANTELIYAFERAYIELLGEDDYEMLKSMCLRHIFGVDIDKRAIETAKLNIWKELIKLEKDLYRLEKVRKKGKHHIFPDLSQNIKSFNSLEENFEDHFGRKFTGVVGNPPYGDLLSEEEKERYGKRYTYSTMDEIASLFVEKAIEFLEDGGVLSFVITYGIAIREDFSQIRNLLANSFERVFIWNFDRDRCDLFNHTMTQSVSIFIAENKNAKEKEGIYTSQFLRSITKENFTEFLETLELSKADNYLLPRNVNYNQRHRLPKIGNSMNLRILDKLYGMKRILSEIIDKKPHETLYIRTSGNYWYNAWDFMPYESTSMQAIRVSQEYKDLFLLIINSSLFYFWHRIYGDGRSMSKDIMLEFPLPAHKELPCISSHSLSNKLMQALREVFEPGRKRFRTSEVKQVIDLVDIYLGFLYELTPDEIYHILDYDKEVRGGAKVPKEFFQNPQVLLEYLCNSNLSI